MSIIYGVRCILCAAMSSTDQMLQQMETALIEGKYATPGEKIVFVAGQPVGLRGSTNMLKLHSIGGIPK
jgi:pyruvate kinase